LVIVGGPHKLWQEFSEWDVNVARMRDAFRSNGVVAYMGRELYNALRQFKADRYRFLTAPEVRSTFVSFILSAERFLHTLVPPTEIGEVTNWFPWNPSLLRGVRLEAGLLVDEGMWELAPGGGVVPHPPEDEPPEPPIFPSLSSATQSRASSAASAGSASASAAPAKTAEIILTGKETPRGTPLLAKFPGETDAQYEFRIHYAALTAEQRAIPAPAIELLEVHHASLPSPLVPLSNEKRLGGPRLWHFTHKAISSNKKIMRRIENISPTTSISPAYCDLLRNFFDVRESVTGAPLSHRLGVPEPQADGWVRIPFLPTAARIERREKSLKRSSDYEVGWHGTSMYALPAIIASGSLHESNPDAKPGTRAAKGVGVYLHKSENRHKAAHSYSYYHNLFHDGVLVGPLIEVKYPRDVTVRASGKTDQIIVPQGEAVVSAVCLRLLPLSQFSPNFWFFPTWQPEIGRAHV
jgi:hypothetical protein